MNKNIEYIKIINHPFYNSGGIKTNLKEIDKFILNPICKNKLLINSEEDKQLLFEYIDSKDKLLLPMIYKALIEITPNDNIEEFTKLLCNKYINKSSGLDLLLNSLKSLSNIPIELLSKYYTRIYTEEKSHFYNDMNKDLRQNKKFNYLPYIKVLYEGVRLQSLPLSSDKTLYRGSLLSNKEIETIKKYLNNKIEDLPGAIIFSRAFLSFSKDINVAKYFLNLNENKNKELSKVLYILEKDDNLDYSLSTHADLNELSFYNEKEVLFFPFSSFEIKSINEIFDKNEKIYEIKLLYLGKYIKKFKEDKVFNEKEKVEKVLPNSEFKKEIIKFGLINSENINKRNNCKELIKKYEEYKENISNNEREKKNDNIRKIIKKIETNENAKREKNENNNKPVQNSKELCNNIIKNEENISNNNNEDSNNRMKKLIDIFNNNKSNSRIEGKNDLENKNAIQNKYMKNEDKNNIRKKDTNNIVKVEDNNNINLRKEDINNIVKIEGKNNIDLKKEITNEFNSQSTLVKNEDKNNIALKREEINNIIKNEDKNNVTLKGEETNNIIKNEDKNNIALKREEINNIVKNEDKNNIALKREEINNIVKNEDKNNVALKGEEINNIIKNEDKKNIALKREEINNIIKNEDKNNIALKREETNNIIKNEDKNKLINKNEDEKKIVKNEDRFNKKEDKNYDGNNKPSESIKNKIDKDEDLGKIYYYISGKISTEYLSKLRKYDISEKKSENILKYCVWNEIKKNDFLPNDSTKYSLEELKKSIEKLCPSKDIYDFHLSQMEKNYKKMKSKNLSKDDKKGCALSLSYYTGHRENNSNERNSNIYNSKVNINSISKISTDGNRGNSLKNIEDFSDEKDIYPIIYYIAKALNNLPLYKGYTIRCIELTHKQAQIYEPGNIITWNQWSSSTIGKNPSSSFKSKNAWFYIYSVSSRDISQFLIFTSEK